MKHPAASVLVFAAVAGAVACGGGTTSPSSSGSSQGGSSGAGSSGASAVTWSFNGTAWQSSGSAPACPSPLLGAPVDLSRATAVLYPGQVRGGDYKPHGGFRFDQPGQGNAIGVSAPMDAVVYRGARYIENGETQYLFDFINSCGIMFRFDHLLDLSARFASIAATLPASTASSATTTIGGQTVAANEAIATAVGFRASGNVSVDWGVYDLRQRNPATTSRSGELAPYAACWLDLMSAANTASVRALPPGDQAAGRASDVCP
jgi:hypothetical protein